MKFDSQQGAQQQIEEWAKATPSISSREKSQIKGRIMDQRAHIGRCGFAEIQQRGIRHHQAGRSELRLIESVSLEVATQIEGLMDHK